MSPLNRPCFLPLLLLTRDADLSSQIEVHSQGRFRLQYFDDAGQLEGHLQTTSHVVLVLDLRCPGGLEICRTQIHQRSDIEWIVLGMPASNPLLDAESIGVCGRMELPLDPSQFQALTLRAQRQLTLQIENANLRGEVANRQTALQPPSPGIPAPTAAPNCHTSPLGSFSRSLRHIHNVQNLMENIVESVAGGCLVSRVGIFARAPEDEEYQLYAGLRCLDSTRSTRYKPLDPLVRWLEINACQVVRGHLRHVENYLDRVLLQHELDAMGAELIIPLQGRRRLWGWLFVGQRGTGLPFAYAELEHLLLMADHISTTLENAFLYEEATLQKTMAETLLRTIPSGIVSVTQAGRVATVNQAAEAYLDLQADTVRQSPVGVLGSRMADVLLRALRTQPVVDPVEWVDPRTKRNLTVEARRLMNGDHCLGAVAFIQDVTEQRKLQEKEGQIERMTFWSDLAAHMSHEVRNPLQAINTYAQLLPERYEDPEFRADFSRIVGGEVDRLNQIINRISAFADPPQLQFVNLRMEEIIDAAVHSAQSCEPYTALRITTLYEDQLPSVSGDARALTDCFTHIVMNACEATYDLGRPNIQVRIEHEAPPGGTPVVRVTVRDNGPGVSRELMEKIFSPFCTSKPHRMGLGLPIAKRTVIDHNGAIEIQPSTDGTEVIVRLPTVGAEVAVS